MVKLFMVWLLRFTSQPLAWYLVKIDDSLDSAGVAPVLKKIQLKLFCAAKKCTFLIYHILEDVKSLTMFPTIISFFRHLLMVDLIMAVSSLKPVFVG